MIQAADPPPDAWPLAELGTITGDENLLLLVARPGDESLDCGGLVARSCRRGRQPFVMVLHDGSTGGEGPPDRLAARRERETRDAVRHLGLRPERLLMAGLFDGPTPAEGPVFEAVVRAVGLVMWARDCNLIVAPWPRDEATRAVHRIAAAVAAGSGVAHLAHAGALPPEDAAEGWRLDVTAQGDAKRAAIAAHASQVGHLDPARLAAALGPWEVLLRPPH